MRFYPLLLHVACIVLLFQQIVSFSVSNLRSHDSLIIRHRRRLSIGRTTAIASSSKNGVDPENYPYCFKGRFLFAPKLVKVPEDESLLPPPTVSLLSLFGYTLGGVVALEYDESPCGPYREYVTMGGLVMSKSTFGAIGQWGSRLFVSTEPAAEICQDLWGVPAEVANIMLEEEGVPASYEEGLEQPSPVKNDKNSSIPQIQVTGWKNFRLIPGLEMNDERSRFGGIPVLWTPTIKTLWSPLVLFRKDQDQETNSNEDSLLPLYRLRLSGSKIKIQRISQEDEPETAAKTEVNTLATKKDLGFALVVDNLLIEISEQKGVL